MPTYPDRRKLYSNAQPNNLPPGTPKFDNPQKRTDVVYSRPAVGRKVGDAFRTTTAPQAPELPPMPEPLPAERIPSDWALPDANLAQTDDKTEREL